jgi:hypothetical protein
VIAPVEVFNDMPVGITPLATEYVKPLLVLVSPSYATGAVMNPLATVLPLLPSYTCPKLPAAVCQAGGALPPPRPCLEIIGIYNFLDYNIIN